MLLALLEHVVLQDSFCWPDHLLPQLGLGTQYVETSIQGIVIIQM